MATMTREPHQRITNIIEYCRLRTVRANTGLINGKIVYDGITWDDKDYFSIFPEPKLQYDINRLDKTQIEP